MGEFIVTDLTRFRNPKEVCIGVIDLDSGQCLRPHNPYISSEWVDGNNIQPADVLEGELTIDPDAKSPHVEDAHYSEFEYAWTAHSSFFREILRSSLSGSVAEGFGADFWYGKFIPAKTKPKCSLVTIQVSSNSLKLSECHKEEGRIRATFVDSTGIKFKELPITDRGFPDYNSKKIDYKTLPKLQELVKLQDEIYLRLGVGRQWQGKYWLQVNGIYMFPEFKKIND